MFCFVNVYFCPQLEDFSHRQKRNQRDSNLRSLNPRIFSFSLQTIMQTNYAINGLSQLSANNLIVDT